MEKRTTTRLGLLLLLSAAFDETLEQIPLLLFYLLPFLLLFTNSVLLRIPFSSLPNSFDLLCSQLLSEIDMSLC